MADQDPRWPDGPGQTRRRTRASLLLEACALSRGISTIRVGPRAFASAPPGSDVGFHGGTSLETSRVSERICADRVMRKALLSQAGVPVPPSAVFGFEDPDQAARYAAQLGGPVLLKTKERTAGRPLLVPAGSDVAGALEQLRSRVPSSSAYLVEGRVPGTEYAFCVVGGQVVSAVQRQRGAWHAEVARDGEGDVHPDVLALAVQVVRALPSVPHGTVRMKCQNAAAGAAGCTVVSVRPAIGLIGRRPPAEWSVHVADRMVAHAARNMAVTGQGRGRMTAAFTMTELADTAGMTEQVREWIGEAGLDGTVQTAGQRQVSGSLSGAPGRVVLLSGLAVTGKLGGQVPQSVTLQLEKERA